jgi:hypothetical protein
MHAITQYAGVSPDWQAAAAQRLRVSMLVSAAALAAALSLFRLPSPAKVTPLLELVVELTRPQPIVRPEPETIPVPPLPAPVEEQPAIAPGTVTESLAPDTGAAGDGAPTDWDVEREAAIREVLDAAAREQGYSVNPPFQRAREEAAVRFRASVAPEERDIWENVEKDQLGRTILRDGNCFRVLDDPGVANRWAFENFDQYIVYCDLVLGKDEGRNLPWVEVIRERYPYLRDPVAIP